VATKSEVINFLKKNYHHDVLDDGVLKLVLEGGDSDRSQLVYAFVYDVVLSLASPFARVGQISDSQALNSDALLGVAKVGDFYVLRHLVPLENVDENEIVDTIEYLATTADEREASLGLGDEL